MIIDTHRSYIVSVFEVKSRRFEVAEERHGDAEHDNAVLVQVMQQHYRGVKMCGEISFGGDIGIPMRDNQYS